MASLPIRVWFSHAPTSILCQYCPSTSFSIFPSSYMISSCLRSTPYTFPLFPGVLSPRLGLSQLTIVIITNRHPWLSSSMIERSALQPYPPWHPLLPVVVRGAVLGQSHGRISGCLGPMALFAVFGVVPIALCPAIYTESIIRETVLDGWVNRWIDECKCNGR